MSSPAIRRLNDSKRRGTIAIFALFFLAVVVVFLAFSLDFGHISHSNAELQSAVDSAARAGARALYQSPADARTAAIDFAAKNSVGSGNDSLTLTAQDIEIGVWDEDMATFTLLSGTDEAGGNAVRVTGNSTVSLYFARIFGNASTDLQSVSIAMMKPKMCGGFVGIDNASIGAFSDSYRSKDGSYYLRPPRTNGHVCSNGSIAVQNGIIFGDARPGIGNNVNVSGQGHVTGLITPHLPYTYPAIDAGNAATVNNNGLIDSQYFKQGGLDIPTSQSTTFPGGVLYLEDAKINEEFRITGPTTIYIKQEMSLAGSGIVNDTQVPSNLKIYLLGQTTHQSKVSGSADFHGIIYGPTVDIQISGSANFFGSAIAWDLDVSTNSNGTGIHFDESITPFHKDLITPKIVQ